MLAELNPNIEAKVEAGEIIGGFGRMMSAPRPLSAYHRAHHPDNACPEPFYVLRGHCAEISHLSISIDSKWIFSWCFA